MTEVVIVSGARTAVGNYAGYTCGKTGQHRYQGSPQKVLTCPTTENPH